MSDAKKTEPANASAAGRRDTNGIDLKYAENLTRILEFIPDPLFAIDMRGIILVWNRAMEELTGHSSGEMVGKGNHEYGLALYGMRRPMIIDLIINPGIDIGFNYRSITRSGDSFLAEAHMPLNNGKIADLWGKAGPLYDSDNLIIGAIESIRDITPIRKIERSLRESENKYRAMVESSPIGMHFYILRDDDSLILSGYNPSAETLLHVPHNSLIGRTVEETFPSLSDNDVISRARTIAREGGKIESDIIRRGKDALISAFRISLFQIAENMIVVQFQDISAAKKTENALRMSEEKFRTIFENMPIGFFRTDLHGRLIEGNPMLAKIFGYDSAHEMMNAIINIENDIYVNPKNRHTLIEAAIRDDIPHSYTFKMKKKDGTPFPANIMLRHMTDIDGKDFFEGLIEDGSERLKIEDMMVQSEKMRIITGLSSGMAHEINNPLGIILQTAENAIRRLTVENDTNIECASRCGIDFHRMQEYIRERKIDHYLEGIRDAGLRASEIVKHMLQFSRRSESKIAPHDINELIDKTLELAQNDYDLNKRYDFKLIKIIKSYESGLIIPCTETEIEQVILNLLKNSAQAMSSPEHPVESPFIRIVTKRI
ncbi:MAG TPA: PAS domain S-box protein, partial [Spirochaetota bacterium]|nr:PAS domain S-box protein [Spirochaetota bacterium]